MVWTHARARDRESGERGEGKRTRDGGDGEEGGGERVRVINTHVTIEQVSASQSVEVTYAQNKKYGELISCSSTVRTTCCANKASSYPPYLPSHPNEITDGNSLQDPSTKQRSCVHLIYARERKNAAEAGKCPPVITLWSMHGARIAQYIWIATGVVVTMRWALGARSVEIRLPQVYKRATSSAVFVCPICAHRLY